MIARKMAETGLKPEIFIFASSKEELSPSCRTQFELAQNFKLNLCFIKDFQEYLTLKPRIQNLPFLLDSLLGTGLKNPLQGLLKEVIQDLNRDYCGKIMAIDLPSGFSGQEVFFEPVLKAHTVFTVETLKTGMTHEPGRSLCGMIEKVKIGIPEPLLNHEKRRHFQVETKDLVLPKRPADSHKGHYGKTLICAGSASYPGAARLSLSAALKTGAGFVYWHGPDEVFLKDLPEVIPLKTLPENLDSFTSIAAGPGWYQGDPELLERLLHHYSGPLILDADALNLISKTPGLLKNRKNLLLTPHLGEFSRLMNTPSEKIRANRMAALRDFSTAYPDIAVLLKDAVSTLKWGEFFFDLPWGCSALARAGSGDLLTGLIAGFAAYHPLKESVFLAGFINGRTAEILSAEQTPYAFSASALPEHYHRAFKELVFSTPL